MCVVLTMKYWKTFAYGNKKPLDVKPYLKYRKTIMFFHVKPYLKYAIVTQNIMYFYPQNENYPNFSCVRPASVKP